MLKSIGPGATGLAMVLMLSACGDSEQSREAELESIAAEYGVDLDVEINEETGEEKMIVQQGSFGGVESQAGMNLDLPDGFPDDVATYPGMQVYGSSGLPMGVSISALSDDTQDEVAAYFSEQMVGKGWTDESGPAPAPSMRSLRFTKDNRTANLTLLPGGEGGTAIQMTVLTMP
ncbi:MAG: hypothetical protein ACE363_09465 [Alphaproteobacteria bacterium]